MYVHTYIFVHVYSIFLFSARSLESILSNKQNRQHESCE